LRWDQAVKIDGILPIGCPYLILAQPTYKPALMMTGHQWDKIIAMSLEIGDFSVFLHQRWVLP
jgi:hypothetical protein